jgi:hypothetical protein
MGEPWQKNEHCDGGEDDVSLSGVCCKERAFGIMYEVPLPYSTQGLPISNNVLEVVWSSVHIYPGF